MAGVVQPQPTCPHPGQVRQHKFRKKQKGGYVHIARPSTCSRAQAGLDQIAECSCADSGIQVTSTMAENAKISFRMKELAQWVAKQLQPYQTAELADAQDRIKELESSWPSNTNVVQLKPSEALSPQSLHTRKAHPVPRG